MPHLVERPFIPHHTPTKGRAPEALAEFRLAKPFVPGATRNVEQAPDRRPISAEAAGDAGRLPGIEEFLQVERSAVSLVEEDAYGADFNEPDELPPVEHFLDPLPAVTEFSPENPVGLAEWNEDPIAHAELGKAGETEHSDWLETDWQNYDWRAAAALGGGVESEASSAWATTDWDAGAPPRNSSRADEPRPTAAQEIASALDQIAERIRTGELVVPSPGATSDPASIAAALAAMLGIRR